jgi:hypothetical protein
MATTSTYVSPGTAESAALFDRLRATAARLIAEHADAHGCCASCGRAWPCDIACRAEFFLGM